MRTELKEAIRKNRIHVAADASKYVFGCIVIIMCYLFVSRFQLDGETGVIQLLMLAAFVILGVRAGVCIKKGTATKTFWIQMILLAGCIMRVGYMLYTGCDVRSYDLWEFSTDSYGHAAYILTIMQQHHLPDTNMIQFYQQPLFYLLGSGVSGVVNGILQRQDVYALVDAAKLVSCMASCGTLILAEKICKCCRLRENGTVAALLLVAFLPDFYLTGGRVNCDALACFFMTAAVLVTIRWYRNATWKRTIFLAVVYGCAMMTKVSCGVIALFTAAVFIWKLYQSWKKKQAGKYLLRYLVFAGISFPLGLWYAIRNYRLFGQGLTYVLRISEDSEIYTGDHSLVQRLFAIAFPNLLQSPYAEPWEDYNAPVYYLKSALFGEFKYEIWGWIPVLLLFFAFVLAVCVCVAWLWQLRFNRSNRVGMVMAGLGGLYYVSVLWFYIQYPFGCSMDFRYMTFLAIPAAIVLGLYQEQGSCRWFKKIMRGALLGFSLFSCLMYLGIS